MESDQINFIIGEEELVKVEKENLAGTQLKAKKDEKEIILSDSEGENSESEEDDDDDEEESEISSQHTEKTNQKKQEQIVFDKVEQKKEEKEMNAQLFEKLKQDYDNVKLSQGDVQQTESIILKGGKMIKQTKRVSVTKLFISNDDKTKLLNTTAETKIEEMSKITPKIRETQEIILDNEFAEESNEEGSDEEKKLRPLSISEKKGSEIETKKTRKIQEVLLENEIGVESNDEQEEEMKNNRKIRQTQEIDLGNEMGEEIGDSESEEELKETSNNNRKNRSSRVENFIKSDNEEENPKNAHLNKRKEKEFIYEEKGDIEYETEEDGSVEISEESADEDDYNSMRQVKKVNNNKKTSYAFEDNSMRQTLIEGDMSSEEEEDENYQFLQKKSTVKNSNNQETEYDREKGENALILKKKMSQLIGSMGCCIFMFIISSLLWIILFKKLHDNNQWIGSIVLKTPTLGQYHELYTKFYNQFDLNRDKLFDTEQILEFKNNSAYSEFKGSIEVFLSTQNRANDHLLEIKASIYNFNNKLTPDNRRVLTKGGGKPELAKKNEDVSKLITHIETFKAYLKQMQDLFTFTKAKTGKFGNIYDQAIDNLKKLYENCFLMIDLYGEFYIMTNRIWVTTENIFRLFENRSEKIKEEIKKEHFNEIKKSYTNIYLNELNYMIGGKVPNIEINIEVTERTDYLCEVSYMIKNDDLTMVDNVYNLYLINDEKYSTKLPTNTDFDYRVEGISDKNSFDTYFSLDKGTHKLELYAKLQKGNVGFSFINIQCLEFLEYPRIKEFDK